MTIKLLAEKHLEFLTLKEAVQARLSLQMSKCLIVGNHMSRLKYFCPLTYILFIFLKSLKAF